jgi:hypothetical protein
MKSIILQFGTSKGFSLGIDTDETRQLQTKALVL